MKYLEILKNVLIDLPSHLTSVKEEYPPDELMNKYVKLALTGQEMPSKEKSGTMGHVPRAVWTIE